MEFDNKRVLITGSTAGIGREAARLFAGGGGNIVVSGRNASRGQDVVAEIERDGGRAEFIAADLNDVDSVRDLAARAGNIDVLVNNAAGYAVMPTPEVSVESFDEMFAINVRAPFLLTAALAPGMAARRDGAIVNVSTMASNMGLPGMALYSSTKGALNSLTRTWAAEFGPDGVRVNTIAPGPTGTDMVVETLGDEGAAYVASLTILNRLAKPAEIAEVIVFLASDRASFITGATIAADAGATAR